MLNNKVKKRIKTEINDIQFLSSEEDHVFCVVVDCALYF